MYIAYPNLKHAVHLIVTLHTCAAREGLRFYQSTNATMRYQLL